TALRRWCVAAPGPPSNAEPRRTSAFLRISQGSRTSGAPHPGHTVRAGGSPESARPIDREVDPHRNVVRRLFPTANLRIDAGRLQAVSRLRRQQKVIDSDPVVLLPCPGLVVPERIEVGPIARRPYGV